MATPADLFSLTGSMALVTGASGALGAHFARVLHGAGARVALAARRVDADLIVTIGGGSITDAAKAVQLCLANGIDSIEAMDRLRPGGAALVAPRVRQIAVPTTLSAGEFSAVSGVTDERSRVKELFRHPDIIPAAVVLDAQLRTPPDAALLALQGPLAVTALERLVPGVDALVFMSGQGFVWQGHELFLTRSGYTGEDGFEISIPSAAAPAFARALLQQPEVKPIGLGARNSLRLEAGLCLHGNDIDSATTPAEANLLWAVQKVRRSGGARAGGFIGAPVLLAQIDGGCARVRVGLRALERVPVREHTALHLPGGAAVGEVTSGLLGPSADAPIAMAYVDAAHSAPGTRLDAMVRGKPVPMQICPMPFVPHRYHRG
jgi:glycine cleavage system aminomethyltransferase T